MEESPCTQFQPNQEMLQSLINIGISKEAGEQVSSELNIIHLKLDYD